LYTDYFGLREKPFELSPDPRFLYLSEGHKEAFAHLKYGIMERMGFVMITGDVGTGKTTLVNALLEELDPEIRRVHLADPGSTTEDLFAPIKKALDLPVDEVTKGKFLPALHDFMKNELGGNEPVLLVIDEAQRLSPAMLEEIRLLSNIETPTTRLFEIFLVGQRELDVMLQARELRQLRQRIGVKYHLNPLNLKDTQNYIVHRLQVAGLQHRPFKGDELFSPEAIRAIYNHTQGYPRLINIICDSALRAGYAKESVQIDRKTVSEVIRDMKVSYEVRQKRGHLKFAWILIVGLLMAVLAYGLQKHGGVLKVSPQVDTEVETQAESKDTVVTDESQPSPVSQVAESELREVLEEPVETSPQPSQQQMPEPKIPTAAVTESAPREVKRARIKRSAIALNVRNREPTGVSERVSVRQQRVYCWMQVVDGQGGKVIVRWISKGQKVGETHLRVGSKSWRTWSYITLRPGMVGLAEAQILDENGQLLETLSFEIVE